MARTSQKPGYEFGFINAMLHCVEFRPPLKAEVYQKDFLQNGSITVVVKENTHCYLFFVIDFVCPKRDVQFEHDEFYFHHL